ncbi:MAG: respiratory nitrate reductase subunit gamma [Candidatus Sericytochromatia bacterium]|nr:respiratory nitrate reductase subunit gamma [Candidatus Tanganyikabacteria bacterium]
MLENFFFVALPYITLLLFVGGSLYRAFTGAKTAFRGKLDWSVRGDLMWTTRSSGFFGRASIGPAVLCLHWGFFILLIGHVAGFIGGATGMRDWVEFFRWVGMFGGILLLYGVTWAFVRRLSSAQLTAMSTREDLIVLLFLIAITAIGLYQSAVKLAFGASFDVGPWFAGIFTFQPDAALIAGAPLLVKTHMVLALTFFAYLPFTKLVHAFSYPFSYASRPPISVRSIVGLKH